MRPQDLNNIYTGDKDPFIDPPPAPPPVPGTGRRQPAPQPFNDPFGEKAPAPSYLNTPLSNINLANSDVQKFLGNTGVPNPLNTGQDIELMMGNRQSFGNKLARRMGALVPNIAAHLIDMVGNVGSLAFEWGDDRDYNNGLNEIADNLRGWTNENIGVTHRRSNDVWAIGDPTWWIDNIFNTVEYAGAYAAAGAGVAGVLGNIAKGIGTMAGAGADGAAWLQGAARLGTSALVSYAQGAQDGASVFNEVYENQLRSNLARGMDTIEAQRTASHTAAQAAATTAQLSTILTMGINAGAYAPVMKSQQSVLKDIFSKRLAQAERGEISSAIRGMNVGDFKQQLLHHSGIKGVLDEMWREGGEEVLQQFAHQTGLDVGKEGKNLNFLDQFGELENLLDRSANSEGMLAFVLGAGFGGLQHGLLHNVIPTRRVTRYDDAGNPIARMGVNDQPATDDKGQPIYEKHWVSGRTYEKDFTKRNFDKMKDALASDFEKFDEMQSSFVNAMNQKNPIEADEIRDEMFNVGKLNAVKMGLTEPWKRTFEEIGAMTQEQAMAAGYADDQNDTAYKERAREAISDMDQLTRRYQQLQDKYKTDRGEDPRLQPLVDMVFAREADLMSSKKRIDRYRKDLEQSEKEQLTMPTLSNPDDTSALISKYLQQHKSGNAVLAQLNDDINTLRGADQKAIDRILKKYRAIGFGIDNNTEAVRDTVAKIAAKAEQINREVEVAETAMLQSTDFQGWLEKNPGGSFQQYMNEVNKTSQLGAVNTFRRSQLDKAQTEYDIAQQNLKDMTSEKNAAKFVRKADEWRKNMIAEAEEIEKTKAANMAKVAKDQSTVERLNQISQNRIADRYRNARDQMAQKLQDNLQRLAAWKAELKSLGYDPLRARALKKLIRQAEEENKMLSQRGRAYDALYNAAAAAVVQTQVTTGVTTEAIKVDGSENGTTTDNADNNPTTSTGEDDTTLVTDEDFLAAMEAEAGMPIGEDYDRQGYATIEDELAAIEKAAMEAETTIVEDPIEAFTSLAQNLNAAVQRKLQILSDGMLSGEFGHSLDALNEEIAAGLISAPEAHRVLIALRDYVNEVRDLTQSREPEPISDVEQRKALGKLVYNPGTQTAAESGEYTFTYVRPFDLKELDKMPAVRIGPYVLDNYGEQRTFDNFEEGQKWLDEKYASEQRASPEVVVSDLLSSDTPVIDDSSNEEFAIRVPAAKAYHAGYKIVEAAHTGGTRTIGYEEGIRMQGRLKKYIKVTIPDKLTEGINEDILKAGKLPPGHPLRYEVAVDYEGPKMITDDLSWDENQEVVEDWETAQDYLTPEGKVTPTEEKVGNVPIRVVDGVTGAHITWIRKMDWVEAQFPGATNKRNVVMSTKERPNNYQDQRRMLMELRQAIVDKYNADGSASEGKIGLEGKGTGRAILNVEIKRKQSEGMKIYGSKVVPKLAWNVKKPDESLLPDSKLELVIVSPGFEVQSGREFATTKKLGFDPREHLWPGAIGALIPSANGEYLYAPLIGDKIVRADRKISAGLNSIVRAIELYMLNDGTRPEVTAEIAQLEQNTGFNLATATGLRSFINQYYTYLQGFKDSDMSPNSKSNTNAERFVFNVDDLLSGTVDKTRQIKVGFTKRGAKAVYANLVNGALSPKFVETLKEGLATRSRAVVFTDTALNIKGINSTGGFTDAIFNAKTGKWQHNRYDSYNQYVKSFSRTPVYGRNQLSDGSYVYVANPHVPITDPPKARPVKVNTTVAEVKPPTTDEVDRSSDMMDIFGNFSHMIEHEAVQEIGTGPLNSLPLTVENLRKAYTFTPEAQRNGKTVEQVWDELNGRGHTFLADGFNPFSRCI